jgi:hypothetical protein
MFVHFDGNGQIVVSETTIRSHTDKPQRLRATDAEDALRLNRLSWKEEGVCVHAESQEEREHFTCALHAMVWRDMYRDPHRCMG